MEKQRNGFITVWLGLIIIVNVFSGWSTIQSAVTNSFVQENIRTITALLGGLMLVVAAGAALVLAWRKIGFWLIVGAGVAGLCLSCVRYFIYGDSVNLGMAVLGAIVGPILMYAILQIRKNGISCWSMLE